MTGQPVDHPGRLEALADTRLLDSLPDESFDRFTRIARSLLGVEISLVTLVDRHRQYFKSECGLGEPLRSLRQNDMSYSFCRFVVEGGTPFIVEDARQDPRVSLNPAVTELGVVAYLGMPISSSDGYVLGSLCAVGTSPRKWSALDMRNLADLASAVTREIELAEQSVALQQALDLSKTHRDRREWELRTIVHDLRTPAAAVSSCLQLFLRANLGLNADDRELIDLSKESATQILDMVEQILEVDRLRSGAIAVEKRSVSVSRILRRAARIIRPQATESGVTIELPQLSELIEIEADEPLFERVLLNLLNNAIKYSPQGGTVKIDARPFQSLCHISVTDRGPGVPDSQKKTIFDQFTTGTIPSNSGVTSFGIGLSFCKTAVELHGGEIGVKDPAEGGSEFYCLFPISVTNEPLKDAPKVHDMAC